MKGKDIEEKVVTNTETKSRYESLSNHGKSIVHTCFLAILLSSDYKVVEGCLVRIKPHWGLDLEEYLREHLSVPEVLNGLMTLFERETSPYTDVLEATPSELAESLVELSSDGTMDFLARGSARILMEFFVRGSEHILMDNTPDEDKQKMYKLLEGIVSLSEVEETKGRNDDEVPGKQLDNASVTKPGKGKGR